MATRKQALSIDEQIEHQKAKLAALERQKKEGAKKATEANNKA